MPYRLEYPESVRSYLWGLPLSPEGRIKVSSFIQDQVAGVSDAFRNDPLNRLPNSPRFQARFLFFDGNVLRALRLVVDDSAAADGVLRIVYADFG